MPSLQPSPDYTDRDLASLRTRFQALIASVFPSWTDRSTSNFGSILLDLYAWSADIQGFALDAQANEAFLPTAVQRGSLLKLAALVGYTPVGISGATTLATFTGVGLTGDAVIKAGTIVSTLDQQTPVLFQTLSDLTLSVAQPVGSVAVENSANQSDTLVSTGEPSLSFLLGSSIVPPLPYLDGSLSLSTTAQGEFTQQKGNSFIVAGPSDQVYVVKVDADDQATVVFGDDVAGLIPLGTINASWRTGGGAIGNVASHSVQQIVAYASPAPTLGGATITCDNANAATGGVDHEAIESIRENIPASLTTPAVSVARTDFEVHAKEVAGVIRALSLTSNEDGNVPFNTVYIFAIAPGPGAPSPSVLDAVRRQFQSDGDIPPYPLMATTAIRVFASPFVDIDITARIYMKRNAVPATVKAAVLASLGALFATTNADGSDNELIDFGYYLRRQSASSTPTGVLAASDVENAIRDTLGVREVDPTPAGLTLAATRRVVDTAGVFQIYYENPVTMAHTLTWTLAAARQDVQLDHDDTLGPPASSNFPRLGTITLVDADTGLTL